MKRNPGPFCSEAREGFNLDVMLLLPFLVEGGMIISGGFWHVVLLTIVTK